MKPTLLLLIVLVVDTGIAKADVNDTEILRGLHKLLYDNFATETEAVTNQSRYFFVMANPTFRVLTASTRNFSLVI